MRRGRRRVSWLSIVCAALVLAGGARSAVEVLRFEVTVPAETPGPFHLAGDFNGWRPDHEGWRLDPVEDEPAKWVLYVERNELGDAIEFKLTRGSWETVEVAADGTDLPNRRLVLDELEGSVVRLTVAAFADRERASTVTGRLEVFEVESAKLDRNCTVRVWLPPGYEDGGERRYPVLYMQDGQHVFDAATSSVGSEWRVNEVLTELIGSGAVAPWIVVAIDNGGERRTAEYNPPYTPGGWRRNRGDDYPDFLLEELVPRIEEDFSIAAGPENTALGGSSFGASVTLYAAMRHPQRFGAILLESPATWVYDGALIERSRAHDVWPARVFIGVGSRESEDPEGSREYLETVRALEEALRADGLGDERLRVVVEQGASHDEAAWARRLPESLAFLLGPRDE